MKQTCVALALFLAASTAGLAGELKGIELPDSTEVGGVELKLNGMGLREATALKVDVYVAGLYVESPSTDAAALLEAGGPWKIEMHFVRKKVGKKEHHRRVDRRLREERGWPRRDELQDRQAERPD